MSTKKSAHTEPKRGNGLVSESLAEGVEPERDGYLLAADSEQTPTLSVVMPTLNEEEGVADCIDRITNALEAMEMMGEIVVSDSSTDRTPDIAESMGARVVTPDEPGYGYAYQYAFERTRGEYIAIGDADCTYDFEELPKLLELVRDGDADMAMGSRLEGEILPGSMPPLHEHVGNPLLTKFLNVFYDAGVSDAHSGMRVLSRDTLETLDLHTTGMEFASEMIMEAGAKDLRIEEVPITYHPREGEATLESFQDGWRHVKFMLQNAPGYLFSVPGLAVGGLGAVVMALAYTHTSVGPMSFGPHSLIGGTLALVFGVYLVHLAAFASVASNPIREPTDPVTKFFSDTISLERGVLAGGALFLGGGAYMATQVAQWASTGFTSLPLSAANVVALVAMVLGIQTVFGVFLVDTVRQTSGN